MKERRKIIPPDKALVPPTQFTSSGSYLLDTMLGGGWPQRRIVNVVGDKSSGKTLLAVEACANFVQLAPPELIRYVEAEDAWDDEYARTIGMPAAIRPVEGIRTVEALYADLENFLDKTCTGKHPAFYCIDSLDALSDEAEHEREFDAGSYGAAKARKMSELFRRLHGQLKEKNCTLFVVSQIRDKFNVRFGENKQRSGGRALDFYASQIIWLAETGKLYRTVMGAKRAIGVRVMARSRKNKVGKPYRDCELTILFNYGIDDEESMLNWLEDNKAEKLLSVSAKQTRAEIAAAREAQDREILADIAGELQHAVRTHWQKIETALAPPMTKYYETQG